MMGDGAKKTLRGGRRYKIVVRGELSQRFATEFESMDLKAENGRTALSGEVVDQSHLHGLLDRVGDFGLELLRVEAISEKKKVELRTSRLAEAFSSKGQQLRMQKSKEKLNVKDLMVDTPSVVEDGRVRQGLV